jgi:pyruvate kinase
MTESGGTARFLSRFRSNVPIYGLSRHPGSRRRMALMRDVFPIDFDSRGLATREAAREALKQLFELGELAAGDRVVCTTATTWNGTGRPSRCGAAGGAAEGLGEL